MPHNPLLSIAVPTFNRAAVWKELLPELIDQCRPHKIAIYISDNASEDDTQEVIAAAQKDYPYIYYSRNEKNLGCDMNFEKVLKTPDTKYVWFKGDDDRVINNGIEKVLEIINIDAYDMIMTNAMSRSGMLENKLQTQVFNDAVLFFEKTFRCATFMSICVFSKKLLEQADYRRYKEFVHAGIIYDYLAKQKHIRVFYEQTPLTAMPPMEKTIMWFSWRHLFYVFFVVIVDLVLALPEQIPLEVKLRVLRSYNYRFIGLASGRARNIFGLKFAIKYGRYLKYVSSVPYPIFLALSMFPPFLIRAAIPPLRFIKRKIIMSGGK
ncbi:MAG: glycosyltransferase [Helicobacteraceae bacterium]|jgi:glycosyltransferase involved in cell wall biosynthesis|nr:glycosyltransferase [Helicobacteraceae bacterium]